jgi:para-nitrobenzyl esterase
MAMKASTKLVVCTASGDIRGAHDNGVRVFRGVPYAAPPVDALRFTPPQPAPRWRGVRDAAADGPIAPQGRSRLAHVMGDFQRRQSEDCLTPSIWSPDTVEEADLCPVMVWIHGGAFSSGAGSLPWYSGERFAADGVVAVSINYRLGALGFLCLPGVSDGNLGFLDQAAALRWVHENIRAFGGDPNNITVVGQSAGAISIAAHMTTPSTSALFQRAILQSAPIGRRSRTLEDAHRVGKRFLDVLGLKAEEAERLKTLPLARLVEAQGELGRLEKKFADVNPPFGLVVDGGVIATDIMRSLKAGSASEIDIMIGTTREEVMAFFCIDSEVQNADNAAVLSVFETVFKSEHREYYEEFRRMRASGSSADLLGDLFTDQVFRLGSLRMAEWRAEHGKPPYVFQFDWQSPAGFGSCHCLEIPFVFDNLANWQEPPMLKGADPRETAGLAASMHGAWIAFARNGNPNHDGLPQWAPYRQEERTTMRFDKVIGPVSDLAGLKWRRPWPPVPES